MRLSLALAVRFWEALPVSACFLMATYSSIQALRPLAFWRATVRQLLETSQSAEVQFTSGWGFFLDQWPLASRRSLL